MSATITEKPQILHIVPGRIRMHLPQWKGHARYQLETQIRSLSGVRSVQANALTSNALIYFDPRETSETALLEAVQALNFDVAEPFREETSSPLVLREKHENTIRAHIAIRGLERDPALAKRVI